MTFAEIVSEIQASLARSDSATIDRIPSWVNRRQRMAASRQNFAFMRTEGAVIPTVVNQQTYALPSNYKDDHAFYLLKPDGYVLLEIAGTLSMFSRFSPADYGEPAFVTLDPGTSTFRVWPPKPDAIYSIVPLYFAWPADLAGTGTNWFTDNFPELLIAGGVAEGLHFLGAGEEAVVWEQRFEMAFRQAKAHDVEWMLPSALSIVPRWDAGVGESARRRDGWPW